MGDPDVKHPRTHRHPVLEAIRPRDPHRALGMVVAFLMADPAFRPLQFGHWAQVLAGQIQRGHYLFVVEGKRVVGFVGWALATRDRAEAWLAGRAELAFEHSHDGEIVILNTWKTSTPAARRFLTDALRRLLGSKEALYYKRFYADGRVRRARLKVNALVGAHLAHEGRDAGPSGLH